MTRAALATGCSWLIAVYDRVYRLVKGLNHPNARIGPVLLLEMRCCRRDVHLPDGTPLRRGDPVGIIHLANARVARLEQSGLPSSDAGPALRRLVVESLRELAARARPDGPLCRVRAFAAVTIYHRGLEHLGFSASRGASGSALVAAYQRALVAWLHPERPSRMQPSRRQRAHRLWMSRERLLALYGEGSVWTRRQSARVRA